MNKGIKQQAREGDTKTRKALLRKVKTKAYRFASPKTV